MTTVLVAPAGSMEAQCASRALASNGVQVATSDTGDVDVVLWFQESPEDHQALTSFRRPDHPLVLVCPRLDAAARQLAADVGARGVVDWHMPTSAVLGAIDQVAHGQDRATAIPDGIDPLSALTERELEIVRLLREGASNEVIADALGISYHTVRTHVGHVLAKLGVSRRYAVAAVACRSNRLGIQLVGATAAVATR